MAQPSIARYFNTRKRPAVDDYKLQPPAKLIKSDIDVKKFIDKHAIGDINEKVNVISENRQVILKRDVVRKVVQSQKPKKFKEVTGPSIHEFLQNMKSVKPCTTPTQPQKTQTIKNDELQHIKEKMSRSDKLPELKASMQRFEKLQARLKEAERKTELSTRSKVENLKSVEFEITVSPQKVQSPEKPYLSPRKESSVRRQLLSSLSPVKKSLYGIDDSSGSSDSLRLSSGLNLPYKYRTLCEIFRAVDVVAQIMYNRKEVITFTKMKPAVEQMLKRTFTEKHLAQICSIYPTAYKFSQEKLRDFGSGTRNEQWHLVLNPNIENGGEMTSQTLLTRRRNLQDKLLSLTKTYHNEFLLSLSPPITINTDKILHWHMEFDIEKVPEIKPVELPQKPHEETFTSAKQVLEKTREMFGCNTRVEKALNKLKEFQEKNPTTVLQPATLPETSLLKGIPKSLLEKVRQRQAAKALVTMTRSADKEKEIQIYSRLPEISRLLRSLFVTEKKSVLQMDVVIEKLQNSYRCFLNKNELENHLRTISKEVPDWLKFHDVSSRGLVYLKLLKNEDLSIIINKLESRLKELSENN